MIGGDIEKLWPKNFQYFRRENVELCYITYGDRKNTALVLIMGMNASGMYWSPVLCEILVEAGFYVIALDNRDTGKSTQYTETPTNLPKLYVRKLLGLSIDVEYNLFDIADDYKFFLEHLNISKAHFVGVSMGGMIIQIIAGKYPEIVNSIVLMNTTLGGFRGIIPKKDYRKKLKELKSKDFGTEDPVERASQRDELLIHFIDNQPEIRDVSEVKKHALLNSQHGVVPDASLRHTAAIIDSLPFSFLLKNIKAPTLILHGAQELVFGIKGAKKLNKMIENSRLEIIPNMGHVIMRSNFKKVSELLVGFL